MPFATIALGGLSALSVWWIRLGILPDLIERAHPQQNGRQERMRPTLKAEATCPPEAHRRAQQRRLDRFRAAYNAARPHEALGQATPASGYLPSRRPYPDRIPPLGYPAHYEVRRVSRNGGIRWHYRRMTVGLVTHHPRPSLEMTGGTIFHFVTDGIHAALEMARAAAGGRDVRLGGGVATVRQYLEARLVDEMHVAVAPCLLGEGEPLWAGLNLPALGYRCVEHVPSAKATHLVFTRGD